MSIDVVTGGWPETFHTLYQVIICEKPLRLEGSSSIQTGCWRNRRIRENLEGVRTGSFELTLPSESVMDHDDQECTLTVYGIDIEKDVHRSNGNKVRTYTTKENPRIYQCPGCHHCYSHNTSIYSR